MKDDMKGLAIGIRRANLADLNSVIKLDAQITQMAKADYWRDMFDRYIDRDGRHFLIAEAADKSGSADGGNFLGFIVGEVRAWEFGSQPCGWVVAIGVEPDQRVQRIGEGLFDAMSERLRADGVDTIRTMIARDDPLNMSFFRAQGMMAGPFIELEKPLG